MSGKKTAQQSTEDYLKELGVVVEVTAADVVELSHKPSPRHYEGETYNRLKDEYDFHRASTFDDGVSIELALRDGWSRLPESADVRLVGTHDGKHDVYMIRNKRLGREIELRREMKRQERNRRGRSDVSGIHAPGALHMNEGETALMSPFPIR